MNAADVSTRHWYAPCTAPDFYGDNVDPTVTSVCPPPRKCPFTPFSSWASNPKFTGVAAPSGWAPVSRRRHVGAGWHLDVGPGVPASSPRTLSPFEDEHAAGCVVLLALNNWANGEGGTCILPGSHHWVARELMSREVSGAPITHQELNLWAATHMRRLTEEGKVMLQSCTCDGTIKYCPFTQLLQECVASSLKGASPLHDSDPPAVIVQQLVCPPGSICLLHPLMIHSGTLNLGPNVRLLLNGMARLKPQARGTRGVL